MLPSPEEQVERLERAICHVKFHYAVAHKRTRKMTCTLKVGPGLAPVKAKQLFFPDVVTVWDVEKNAWRSWRPDQLISFKEEE